MTSVRRLQLAAGGGEVDEVLALRIDVVAAAVSWYEAGRALKGDGRGLDALEEAEERLDQVVRRYKVALKRRRT